MAGQVHSSHSLSPSHGAPGWQSSIHRGDVYRGFPDRYPNNAYRHDYPYRYGYYGGHYNHDWWRSYHGYRPWNVVWPFWFPSWFSYYPAYRTSYYVDPWYYGNPYASYYGYPEADYYGYGSPGYYVGSSAVSYGAAYPPDSDAVAFLDDSGSNPVSPAVAAEPSDAPAGAENAGDVATGQRFFTYALDAFRRRDYRQAARMANHAMIEMPQDARVHELLSLALFAMGDYRGATMEAHAALAQGPVGDWPKLYAYYQDQPTYAKQLAALEKYLKQNPTSLDARFLLGYHYVMLGHLQEAKGQLAPVVSKASWDTVAAQLLKKAEGGAAAPSSTPSPTSTPSPAQAPSLPPRTPPTGPAEF